MKRINAVILGIITMISLGLILNVLFSDNESLGQSRRRTELVSNQQSTDDEPYYLLAEDAEGLDDADQDDVSKDETENDDSSIQEQPESNTTNQQNGTDLEEQSETQPEENSVLSEEPTDDSHQQGQSNTSRQQQEPADLDEDGADEAHNHSQDDGELQKPAQEDNVEEEVSNNVSIIIDARQNGGSQYMGEIPYERGDSALDILLRFTQKRGISVSLTTEISNRNIFEIDGHQISDIDGRWDLYINGYRSLHEAGANKVTPNSTIRYHYNVNINE